MFRAGFPLPVSHGEVQMSSKSLSATSSPLPSGPMCEDGRPYVTDPITGRQVCLCNLGVDTPPYGPPRTPSSGEGLKPGALPAAGVGSTPPLTFDPSAFYPPLVRGLPLRQDRLPPYLTAGVPGQPPMTFDPVLAAHPYGLLYAGVDMAGNPMRKAATRETTGPLKAWLSEHKKNPYPTKAEKIMLAIITRMTLTQVSTWFANARRRLKKENKLYPGDRDDKDDDDDDDETQRREDMESGNEGNPSSFPGPHKSAPLDSDSEDINVDSSDNSDDDDHPNGSEHGHTGDSKSPHLLSREKISSLSDSAFEALSTDPCGLLRHRALHLDHSSFQRVNDGINQKSTADSSTDDKNIPGMPHKHNQSQASTGSYAPDINASTKRPNCLPPKPKIWSISEIISGSSSSTSETTEDSKKLSDISRERYHLSPPHPRTPSTLRLSTAKSNTPPTSPGSDECSPYQSPSSTFTTFSKPPQTPSSSPFKLYPSGSKSELRHSFPNSHRPPQDFSNALWNSKDHLKLDNSLIRHRRLAPGSSSFLACTQKAHDTVRGWMAKNEDYIIRSRTALAQDTENSSNIGGSLEQKSQHHRPEVPSPRRKSFGEGMPSPENGPSFAKHPSHSPGSPNTTPISHVDNQTSPRAKGLISSPPKSPTAVVMIPTTTAAQSSEPSRNKTSSVDSLVAKRCKPGLSVGPMRSQTSSNQSQEASHFKKVSEQDSNDGTPCPVLVSSS